jgi:hypothetical protein
MKTTKILCIGNSFSEDATTLLNPMLTSYGIDSLVVNLFIGGCSLEQHWENIEHKKLAYEYMKNGVKISTNNSDLKCASINEVILEEQWDIVTIQQSSILSGLVDSFFPEIELLLDYVKKHVKKSCKLYLHEPWSWESSYEWDAFEGPDDLFEKYYSKDDLVMYKQIEKTCLDISKVLNLKVIPSGNFIQFLRSFTEFNYTIKGSIPLSRDKRHMHEIYGRYALSLFWAHKLFTIDVNHCKFYPSDINNEDKIIIDLIKELCDKFIKKKNYLHQILNNAISGGFYESKEYKIQFTLNDFENKLSWYDAHEACSHFGSGWRLPSLDELSYINDILINDILNTKRIFDSPYWSSDDFDNPSYAHGFLFSKFGGVSSQRAKDCVYRIFIVRNKID